jgi:L-fuculose-phosphate aldolase
MDEGDIRFRIAASRRILYREGCDSAVGGHVSARAEGEDAFWVSPFEYFDETVPTGIVKVGFDLRFLDGTGEASPAIQFHAAVYEERPDVNVVIHTHSHYASVVSSTERTIGMYNHEATIFYEDQAVFVEDGISPPVDGKRMAAVLGDRRVLLMKNHGVLIASQSLEHATIEAIMVERAARFHLECEAAGGTECSVEEVRAVGDLYRELYLRNMWAANMRRLRTSDPDLFEYLTTATATATA